jgi:serine/threonine-protein kinase
MDEKREDPLGERTERLLRERRLREVDLASLAGEFEPKSKAHAADATEPTRRLAPGDLYRTRPAPDPRREPWPVEGWERYEFVRFLGAGGMGRVYKAYDRRLGRYVALKFLRGDDLESTQRFLSEARAQARVEHEHVCKIHEVGEVQGKLYIAMQYIGGQTLEEAGPGMTREQKVQVMRQVAEGVHAAHRLGLVHRDIKPANVLVERGEDGRLRPYVTDFGLARELAAPGLTQTGMVMGTPAYMSPEQAKGGAGRLDRRTDVHALGATLYTLLIGRPPFAGANPIEVLRQVVERDPPPPRRLDRTLSPDLETIVLKCLEKDPARRYVSARALAEDLARYAEGEPILARAPTVTYRLLKKTRKHRSLVAAAAVAAAVVVAFAGLAVATAWRAREERRYASLFGQEVAYVEEMLRRAYTAPLHDIRPERRAARARLGEIAHAVEAGGRAARGPGHYALGRALLALDDPERAQRHLERAWEGDYQVPEVAYALGRALGDVYRRALEEAERTLAGEELAERRRELARIYRDPALAHLRRSAGVRVDSPELVQALIAAHERRYEDAVKRAAEARQALPWLYEAWLIEGESLAHLAKRRREGGDEEAADDLYRQADVALRQAVAIGQSDPRTHDQLARLWASILEWVYRSRDGAALERALVRAEAASRAGLTADPGRASIHLRLAYAYKLWAQHRMQRGEDPAPALAPASRAAGRALALAAPGTSERQQAQFAAGVVHLQQAHWAHARRRDSRHELAAAVASFQAVLDSHPLLAEAHVNLGSAYSLRGLGDLSHGRDPRRAWTLAALHLATAANLRPSDPAPHHNLGNLYRLRAGLEEGLGGDPSGWLERATAAYRAALARNPAHRGAQQGLGDAFQALAAWQMDHGRDPRPAALHAVATYERLAAAAPAYPRTQAELGRLYSSLAHHQAAVGLDARRLLRQAAAAYLRAVALDPGDVASRAALVQVQALLALAETAASAEAGARPECARAFGPAAATAEDAQRADPDDPAVWLAAGELEAARAVCEVGAGRSPEPAFARAEASLARAAALEPRFVDAALARADLHRRRAEWRLAAGLPAAADVEAGLREAARCLALRPGWGEAFAVQGALELQAARGEPESSARYEAARRSRESLEEAVRVNRHLQRTVRGYLEQVETLLLPLS